MHEPPLPDLRAPEFDQYESRQPEPRQLEPRFPAAAVASAPPGPLDWLRAKSKPARPTPSSTIASNGAEPPMVEVLDDAPLSPRAPRRQAMPPLAEPALEPKVWSPSRDSGSVEPQSTPQFEQPHHRAAPPIEQAKEKNEFDLVWPDTAPAGEPAKHEASLDMPMPTIPSRQRESSPTEKRPEISSKPASKSASKPASERGPAILKSGVIDGMPYTLYADGSIEAELPHGTVKFASVDALRAHLEKQG
jgi:hypothetical protein